MSIFLTIINFIFFGTSLQYDGAKQPYSCHVTNQSFSEFCTDVYVKTGVRVYYNENFVSGIKVTLNADSLNVETAIKSALKGSGLEVSIWQNNLVVLPKEKLMAQLPVFNPDKQITESVRQSEKSITESEERYLTGRRSDVKQSLIIGDKSLLKGSAKVKILGRVMEQETGNPVIGATMYIEETKTGITSDANGFLSIYMRPGKYNVNFEFLGLEKTKYLFEVYSDGNFKVEMKKAVIQVQEVFVYGDRQMKIKSKDPGLEKISIKTIKEIPMMMGERDILKVSQMLPGIVSVGEGSAGLNVRGGSSDQNAFYIDKVPIYNTSHLFGFFPSFNSDIIKDFSIYKGHIPAQFGGRLSSVFNIITRQGNRKHFTVHGGISPVAANITLEEPIIKDTCSLLLSARSTYSDWILSRISDPTIRSSRANFNDFSLVANYDFHKSQVMVFGYNSNDYFRLAGINTYQYSNSGGSINLNHNFNSTMHGEFAVIASQYSFNTVDKQELSNAYSHSYNLGHYQVSSDFTKVLNEKNTLDFGGSVILYLLNRGSVLPYTQNSLRSPIYLGRERGLESGIYISDEFNILSWLSLSAGLRYTLFNALGPQSVYTYIPGAPKDSRYVNDSIYFGANKSIRSYPAPEIRASLNIETDLNGSIKLAFNQMHQNLFMLNNTISVAPNTQWKLADYHVAPSKNNQVSIGIFRSIPKLGWETSIEVYYKKTDNFPEFKDGADFLNSPHTETLILQGTQNAYGIEYFLKGGIQRLDGWISYTYSHSIIQVNGPHAWNKINEGDAYPASFDIPNTFNSVLNLHISRRMTLSSVISYQTGKPITYPTSVYYINTIPIIDYSKRNEYRIPDYFRADISVTIEGSLKKNKFIHNSLAISVYNLTGRENPYSVFFKTENGRIKSYKYSVIGVPLFTITWLFKLGNYASD